MLAGTVAGGAFLVSFIIGVFGGGPLLGVFLRALVFSGCFFGLVAGIYFLYNKFLLPVETDEEEEPETAGQVGQNIDYFLGDDDDWLGSLDNAGEDNSKTIEGYTEENGVAAIETNAFTGELNPAVSEESAGVLAQSSDNGYSERGDSLLPRKKAGVFSDDNYSMDMSAFVSGMPGIEDDGAPRREAATSSPGSMMNEGTVDMSVERRSGKPDLGFDVDGKKMAGAIQSLLKKDLG
jgi:hypothetical protein